MFEAEQEKETAISRAELWKDLYTKELERGTKCERTEVADDSDITEDDTDMKPEPVSLKLCWKFIMTNLTAGHPLFQVNL